MQTIQEAGAGEVLVTSVNRDGTSIGPDLQLIKKFSNKLTIPFIYAGGIRNLLDMKNAFADGADAVAVGSMFVYTGPHKAVLISYPRREELDIITS